MNNVGYLSHI